MGHHQVLIVGGGAAGITVAARLKKARPALDIAILEPSGDHYYQPGWTLVGGGVFSLEQTRRNEACLLYTSPSPRDATLSRMPSSA